MYLVDTSVLINHLRGIETKNTVIEMATAELEGLVTLSDDGDFVF